MSNTTLDLLLVNPGDRKQIYQSLGSELAAIEPPVWAGLMASFVRRRGYAVQILDANAEGLTPEQTAEQVIALKPRLTAVVVYGHNPSASTQVMPSAGAICTAIKNLDERAKVLLIGGHVAALPERTLREEKTDYVCGDEGLYTLADLIESLRNSPDANPGKVRGLWYRVDGKIAANPPGPLVQNLDEEMPGMAWDLLPMERYRAHNWHCFGHIQRQPYAALYTTLGCPYHCNFCCIQAPFRQGEKLAGIKQGINSYRYWSPQAVIAQIDWLVNTWGVRNIKFADEMFVLNPKHVLEICDLIIDRGYDLNIWAYARVDTTKDRFLEKLKQAGINWLAFGIEAGNDRVRDDVQKGIGQEDIFTTLEKVRNAGINIGANYIFGLPEDDLNSMQDTLDMALQINAEFANFYSAMAYPGSQLYQLALREKWPLPQQWSGYSQHAVDTTPLPTKYLSGAEVLKFRDHAFQVYYSHQPYLDMMMQKFGVETVADIQQMAAHRLKRDALDRTAPK